MSWILDLSVILVVVGTILYYWRRGFVKAILGFGRTLIAFVVAWAFGPKLGALIADKVIGNSISQKVYDLLVKLFDGAAETFNLAALFEQAPENFVQLVERFGGDFSELEAKYGNMTAASRDNLVELSQSIASPITAVISNLTGYILVFLVALILFTVFSGLISKVFELPLLKQINHLLGFLLGLLFAVLNAVIFCFLGAYLIKLIGAISGAFVAEELIAGTHIFATISNFNLFG